MIYFLICCICYWIALIQFEVIFKWYDGWIGFYWDKNNKVLYIFLIPFLGIVIKFKR